MEPLLIIGVILFTGFLFGELCTRLKLPKVTGYIFAGIILNPDIVHLIPHSFVQHTALVTNLSLAFITFSVGGTLYFPKIRRLGKPIFFITLFEAEFAFIFVALAFMWLGRKIIPVIPVGTKVHQRRFNTTGRNCHRLGIGHPRKSRF